jgi:hypothetical protein
MKQCDIEFSTETMGDHGRPCQFRVDAEASAPSWPNSPRSSRAISSRTGCLAAGLSATELVQDYERLAEIVEPQSLPVPICRDPDDDHVLACALGAQAELIGSRDKDPLILHPFQDIPILAAADALQRVDATKS